LTRDVRKYRLQEIPTNTRTKQPHFMAAEDLAMFLTDYRDITTYEKRGDGETKEKQKNKSEKGWVEGG
jgi:hypothetical protein